MKATITKKDGTVIQVEGTADEIRALIADARQESAPTHVGPLVDLKDLFEKMKKFGGEQQPKILPWGKPSIDWQYRPECGPTFGGYVPSKSNQGHHM